MKMENRIPNGKDFEMAMALTMALAMALAIALAMALAMAMLSLWGGKKGG
jgi:hypothetical protein